MQYLIENWIYFGLILVCHRGNESIINIRASARSGVSSLSGVSMANSFKLLRLYQKIHAAIGINPSNSNRTSFNVLLISAAQVGLTTVAFLLFEANSMFDYGFGFCFFVTIINVIIIYLSFAWQSENTSNFIANCEKFTEKSKYQTGNW